MEVRKLIVWKNPLHFLFFYDLENAKYFDWTVVSELETSEIGMETDEKKEFVVNTALS